MTLIVKPAPPLDPLAAVQPCSADVWPASWPTVQLLALFQQPTPGLGPAQARATASLHARQVLHQRAGPAMAERLLQGPRHLRGAQPVSVSHDAALSMLAWCAVGVVGVDLVVLDSLARSSQAELANTASLYLGPEVANAVASQANSNAAQACFAMHWASLEARLKCLGLALDEWCPTRAQTLALVDCVRVNVVDAAGRPGAQAVACVAWRGVA
jgi:phosphopantetheinyl transferase (holo-ACP synthase)